MPVEVVDESADDRADGDADAPPSPLAERSVVIAEAILECVDRAGSELSIALVGDERMRELNREWRGKDSTTDVLSFSQLEGEALVSSSAALGDVVISVDVLRRQAADGGWTEDEELARLLLHGVLHLLGFDHERDDDAAVMHREEARVVGELQSRGIACAWEGEGA